MPELHYEMYDVAIQVRPNDALAKLDKTSVNFHMAWVNPSYTSFQLAFRTFFTIVSLIFLCLYCTKILCRVPPQLQKYLTFEQRGTLSLIFFLFLFNDPLYSAHIYSPSFITFALTEFLQAIFIGALLIYWLRELSMFRPRLLPPNTNCIVKMSSGCLGQSKVALVFLSFFFVVLVIDFMVLNVYYYIYVGGDPSLAGRLNMNNQAAVDVFLGPIIATILLLLFYYAQYSIAFSLGCINICNPDPEKKGRRVLFIAGQVVHFFFILCAIFGVFSRHFDNGGVQLVAYTVINLYVYALCIFNWPVKVYFKEYDIEEKEALKGTKDIADPEEVKVGFQDKPADTT